LDDLDNNFDPNGEITAEKDAKNFCLFFSKKLKPQKRIPAHIKKIEIILNHWQGRSKNASWLIVNSIYNKDVSLETQMASIKGLFNVLHSFEALSYTKYRLIHNLIHLKPDPNTPKFRVIHHLDDSRKEELRKILLDLLKQPTFELNIIALYAFRVLGNSSKDIEKYAHQHIPKPIGSPILTVLDYLQELEPMLTWQKTETERSKDCE
jgi:hypothetical protein